MSKKQKSAKSPKKVAAKKSISKFLPALFVGVLLLVGITVSLLLLINKPNIKQVVTSVKHPQLTKTVLAATTSAILNTKIASKSATTSAQIPENFGRSIHVPVFYYHYIGENPNPKDTARYALSVPPDKFDNQMSYLSKSGYNPISLDTMYAALKGTSSLPPKPIVLTFDDGYEDFYFNAFPILKKYGLHAVSFIPTSLVGTSYYLNWGQISEMNSSGLISFEAHSLTHPNLVSLSFDAQKNQIFESKKVLESHIGHPVNFFAYPYGSSNATSWELVKEAGYLGAGGTWGGSMISEGNIFDFPRLRVPGQSDASFFEKFF